MTTDTFTISGDPGRPILETIAPDDGMYDREVSPHDALRHYFDVGRSALTCIRIALAAANRSTVNTILDLPCGHGRVLRTLRAAYPEASIHACDLLTAGVEFCRANLNAVAIPSHPDPKKVKLKGPYDLIWVGSLFTHFDTKQWKPFLELLHGSLSPNGVCVFTTHGTFAASLIRKGVTGYGLTDPGRLLPPFEKTGFAYAHYGTTPEYGISMSSVSWVANQINQLPNAQIVSVIEQGWATHQDVFAWRKVEAK
jgi:SAM-dependent methyltransferase